MSGHRITEFGDGSKGPRNEHWEVAPGITCIRLTQGKFALVDTVDLIKISGYRWYASRFKHTYYARAHVHVSNGIRTHISMHRLILRYWGELDIDHWNGNGLDNSSISGKLNIRVVAHRVNQQNLHRPKSGAYLGITWSYRMRKWKSSIKVGKNSFHLGFFDDPKEGSDVYLKACADVEAGSFVPPVWPKRPKRIRFKARICVLGKGKHIGYFDTQEEADNACRAMRGRFPDSRQKDRFGRFASARSSASVTALQRQSDTDLFATPP